MGEDKIIQIGQLNIRILGYVIDLDSEKADAAKAKKKPRRTRRAPRIPRKKKIRMKKRRTMRRSLKRTKMTPQPSSPSTCPKLFERVLPRCHGNRFTRGPGTHTPATNCSL